MVRSVFREQLRWVGLPRVDGAHDLVAHAVIVGCGLVDVAADVAARYLDRGDEAAFVLTGAVRVDRVAWAGSPAFGSFPSRTLTPVPGSSAALSLSPDPLSSDPLGVSEAESVADGCESDSEGLALPEASVLSVVVDEASGEGWLALFSAPPRVVIQMIPATSTMTAIAALMPAIHGVARFVPPCFCPVNCGPGV